MLKHLHIQNYRLFKDLKINTLGQVNLIAGKNNTGKTALLEAIALSESNADYFNRLLSSFIKLRGEYDLFNGDMIELFCDKKNTFNKSYSEVQIIQNDTYKPYIQLGETIILYNKSSEKFFVAQKSLFSLETHPQNITYEVLDKYLSGIKNTVIFLPFITSFNISELWENIDLTPRKKDVIKILQTIDNEIVDVGIDLRNRQPKVLLKGSSEPTPLDRFGDGVNRLFRIALCLVNAKNKTLLIDEFEAGLHYSIQEELWDIIFHYAKEWNIQVFVTTHSRDTIKSFYYIANKEEYGDMGNYFALAKERDNVIVVDYDMEEISLALTSNIEIR